MFELSILIVSFNVRDYLRSCITSVIAHTTDIDNEIIVVDNNSSDGSADMVAQEFPQVTLIRSAENLGFARANNLGYEQSRGTFILLLNPDTEIKPGAIQTVLSFMKQEQTAGIAGCRNIGPDNSLQKSMTPFPGVPRNLAQAFFLDRLLLPERRSATYHRPAPFKADSVGGAFMMVRRSALETGLLLNPDYFMYSEEKDLALRLFRKGWTTWFVPGAEIVHYGGKSTDRMPITMFNELQKSQVRFFRNFYHPLHTVLLNGTWWLILCMSALASLPFCATRTGRNRAKLFLIAACAYPANIVRVYSGK